MDDGISRIQGRKIPTHATDVDLPEMSHAIVRAIRRQATVHLDNRKGARFVRISGKGISAVFSKTDWALILKVIQSETLTTEFFPVESSVRAALRARSSTLDSGDPLYDRVLGILQRLFPIKVPTRGPNA